jgi:hypothetical protein
MSYEQLNGYELRNTSGQFAGYEPKNYSGELSNYELRSLDGGLGFSLKPPKWARKMQPGKILKKIAIPLAVVGGALLIPGGGALLAKGLVGGAKLAVGGARLAGKGIFGAGKLLRKGAIGLFKSPVPKDFIGPPAPSGTPGSESVIQQALDVAKQFAPTENVPGGSMTMPTTPSPATTPSGGDGGNYAPGGGGGYGGGGGGSYASYPSSAAAMDESAPDESAPAAAGVGPPQPGMMVPLLIGAGALLLFSRTAGRSVGRSRRARR